MRSPLQTALKIASRRKKPATIRVCDCGTPLIWTFCWAYNERYCLNCGASSAMFGGGTDVPATRELKFKKKLVDSIWHVLYSTKGLLPRSRYSRRGCAKCVIDENHNGHISKTEAEWNEIATKYLARFKGLFDEPQA